MKQKKKKIGTITFHWATNYGAVLQAFALQKHLKNQGYDTEIIDYVPGLTKTLSTLQNLKSRDFDVFKKERKIKKFRRKELILSKKRYFNNTALFSAEGRYSAVICGSDQIWNTSFTVPRRRFSNLSYFLNFAGNAKRISYAVSFGTDSIPEKMKALILPELQKFERLTVRENTGAEILRELGIECDIVADPTLLLTADDYSALLCRKKLPEAPRVFSYILHKNQTVAEDISRFVCDRFGQTDIAREGNCGIYEWLSFEKNADFIVTNSFHGTVFALLFHTPFITVPVEGSGMNDRIHTLLSAVGLQDRIADSCDEQKINGILAREIDWAEVDKKISEFRENSAKFLRDI